jgi:hypothetical protein
MAASPPIRTLFKDGRDASDGTPWEAGTENEPVFVREFIDWEGIPFVFAEDGSLFRMRPSNGANSRYTLESADDTPSATSIAMYGSRITEGEAVALL